MLWGKGVMWFCVFFFQAEDGIRDAQESRGLGDVYKRQHLALPPGYNSETNKWECDEKSAFGISKIIAIFTNCLLYTSDAADDLLCVDLGGRRLIQKKKQQHATPTYYNN